VKLTRSKRGTARPEIPTKEELRAIIAKAEGAGAHSSSPRCSRGLRASELRGPEMVGRRLRPEDPDRPPARGRWKEIGRRKRRPAPGRAAWPDSREHVKEWKLACPKGELGLVFPTGSGTVEYHSNIIHRGWDPTQIARVS
jgi:hypothetical protein